MALWLKDLLTLVLLIRLDASLLLRVLLRSTRAATCRRACAALKSFLLGVIMIACISPESTTLMTLASTLSLDCWYLVRLLELTICSKVHPPWWHNAASPPSGCGQISPFCACLCAASLLFLCAVTSLVPAGILWDPVLLV